MLKSFTKKVPVNSKSSQNKDCTEFKINLPNVHKTYDELRIKKKVDLYAKRVATKTVKYDEYKEKNSLSPKCNSSKRELRKRKWDEDSTKQGKSNSPVFKMPKIKDNGCSKVGKKSAFLPFLKPISR